MGRRILLLITSGWLLLTCWVPAGAMRKMLCPARSLPCRRPVRRYGSGHVEPQGRCRRTGCTRRRSPPPPAAAPASSGSAAGCCRRRRLAPGEPLPTASRRLAALKARLHQRMGAEADPPAEEPAPPPPPGPMIGLPPAAMSARHGHVDQRLGPAGDHLQRRSSRQPLQRPGGHERSATANTR